MPLTFPVHNYVTIINLSQMDIFHTKYYIDMIDVIDGYIIGSTIDKNKC